MVLEVLESGNLAQGDVVKQFEEEFASFCGVKYAVAVNSGTAALHSAIHALGIGKGDEVITVPFTFAASANPIIMEGAKPVFVDVKPNYFNIDVDKIEEKITNKTKAILYVDLYGQPANYDKIAKIAKKHKLFVIEDACQAHGAKIGDRFAGSFGDIACFSFYATKNMACGEGGMITTNNEEYAELCKRFRHHGQSEKTRYEYVDLGYNYRLTNVLAAIGLAQLRKLPGFTKKRIANANKLSKGLEGLPGITVPKLLPGAKHVFHQYTIICDNKIIKRDELLKYLRSKGIGAGIYYPKPLHLHPHFAKLGYKEGDFPVSEMLAKSVLSLPIHPSLSDSDINLIIDTIKEFYEVATK